MIFEETVWKTCNRCVRKSMWKICKSSYSTCSKDKVVVLLSYSDHHLEVQLAFDLSSILFCAKLSRYSWKELLLYIITPHYGYRIPSRPIFERCLRELRVRNLLEYVQRCPEMSQRARFLFVLHHYLGLSKRQVPAMQVSAVSWRVYSLV